MKYFIYWGKKVNSIKGGKLLPASIFVSDADSETPGLYFKVIWRLYKKAWT
jgi:hypothetical protein